MSSIIYFDNAATSWPKPESVAAAMTHYLRDIGGSPGRSGHRLALEAGRMVLQARENLAELFNIVDPGRIVFTKNATEALNTALLGLLKPGDRVMTTAVEHNSVMRPLRRLEANRQVSVTVVPCDAKGRLDLEALRQALRQPTRLVAVTHASNVTGVINPLAAIGALAREAGAALLVDAAQTAGAVPIDVEAMQIDLLAFTGHKSLFGPTGTGGLYVGEGLDLLPLTTGGTGSESEHEFQPEFMPDRLESGTLNSVGLAGLVAGTGFLLATGVDKIRAHDRDLTARLLAGLTSIEQVQVYGPQQPERQASLVSFNVRGQSPAQVGLRLDEEFAVMCRVGLHCAPSAHRVLGTFPTGAVRFSLSCFNIFAEIEAAVAAVRQIANG
ncbi:MAG: aminotransferase class V-fold PLP-dependent enzyme [Chloroflexota bacterium]